MGALLSARAHSNTAALLTFSALTAAVSKTIPWSADVGRHLLRLRHCRLSAREGGSDLKPAPSVPAARRRSDGDAGSAHRRSMTMMKLLPLGETRSMTMMKLLPLGETPWGLSGSGVRSTSPPRTIKGTLSRGRGFWAVANG
jgi:hypothetical protein